MLRPELGAEKGGELNRGDILSLAMIGGAGLVGATAGAIGTAQATKTYPIPVDFSPDIHGEASFTSNNGVMTTNEGEMLYSPNAQVGTHLPGLHGVKVNITRPNLYHELTNALQHPNQDSKIEKQFIGIISKPELAKAHVSESLTSAVVEGASGFAILATGLAVGIKYGRPLHRFNSFVEKIHNRWAQTAVKAGAVLTAGVAVTGCGVKGIEVVNSGENVGYVIPAEISKRSPQLEGARIRGHLIESEIKKANRAIDRGSNDWDRINAGVSTAISRDQLNETAASESNSDKETVVTATGTLCNEGYARSVYQTIQWRYKHDATVLGGDNYMTGHRWATENDCMKIIDNHTIGRNNASALSNHDGKPGPWDISQKNGYAKRIAGNFYISVPDPRDMMGDKQAQPPTGEELKYAIAKAGSIAANKACQIESATGRRPRVVLSTPEMGFETILSGCATSVTSDHYLFSRTPGKPTLRNILTNGRVVHQFVNPSSSGAKTNYEFYKGPQKLAATGLQVYDKATGELSGARSVIYGPGIDAKVVNQDTTTTTRPNQAMINFVLSYSPTGIKTVTSK